MTNKISNFVFLTLFFLLQSCSGGRIGSFLETSFKNNNSNQFSQSDINKKLKSDVNSEDNNFSKKKDKNTNAELNVESNPQIIDKLSSITKDDDLKIKKQNQNYNPKSYRIFVILKKVDPSFPTENFSKVLRDGNINFEIEKIELIPQLKQNRK